jgi:hypothetical protein
MALSRTLVNTVSYTDIARVGQSLGLGVILLAAAVSGACAAKGGVPRPFPVATRAPETGAVLIEPPALPTESAPGGPPAADAESSDGILQTALGFLGIPYRNGGSDPSGFDCSGFVQYVFARHGTPLPREVHSQYQHGQTIDLNDVKPGDLVFFETVSRGASHVGIALGNGRFVHAPSSRGVVRVEPYTASYWARRFVGARRVVEAAVAARSVFPGTIRSASTEP